MLLWTDDAVCLWSVRAMCLWSDAVFGLIPLLLLLLRLKNHGSIPQTHGITAQTRE